MRQIGRSGASLSDGCLLSVEKVIHLGRERSHLVRESRSKPGILAGAHGVKPLSHCIERPQPDGHLRQGSRKKESGEERKRGHKVGREGQPGGMDLSSINRDRYPDSAPAEVCRQGDRALDDKERGLARTGNRMLMDLGDRKTVRWHVQGGVPQGSRPQHRSLRLRCDLPIEPAQRLLEAQLRGGVADVQGPIRSALKPADELAQMRLQFGRYPALDMALEEQQQPETGDREDEEDGGGSSREEAKLERASLHAAARSGTI
ncbi:hypothetical protein [Afipia felis]|uniref:hypothetical protein n=1 Tax=Afipia felis TaxID=1035 RepID=UPI001FCCCC2C|nr:hypothetical protein [Afipia felis]